ncbi:Transcriptional regulator, RpiR family (plasmid) [Cupriavidus necator H850]|uniref:MurR/RpiR family transcriptional regulator n=1 Tax=Cupriavidus necator TaxID=106590 RepID=UPI00129D2274|nr:MurR/RpiR family transcriptional regulator [Cupriavidus necator]KAI3601225.1 Transcriptional regulator, RpiR family [Cupriavidus necator H850]
MNRATKVEYSTIITLLKEQLDVMPKQERQAAKFVMESPQEVAVMSMRDQARMAGVPPSTMTRLAKRLGFAGFDDMRQVFIDSVRSRSPAYGGRVEGLIELNRRIGEHALVQDMANNVISHIQSICSEANLAAIVRSARRLAAARNIYSLGVRSSYSVAFQFAHVAAYFARNVRLVEGSGESGAMTIINQAGPGDVALVCSMPRYARRAVTLANFLHQQGVAIIAITDSPASPVARFASETIIVRNEAPSFFDTATPALLVSEILVALLSAKSKGDTRKAVTENEQKLIGLGEWWDIG